MDPLRARPRPSAGRRRRRVARTFQHFKRRAPGWGGGGSSRSRPSRPSRPTNEPVPFRPDPFAGLEFEALAQKDVIAAEVGELPVDRLQRDRGAPFPTTPPSIHALVVGARASPASGTRRRSTRGSGLRPASPRTRRTDARTHPPRRIGTPSPTTTRLGRSAAGRAGSRTRSRSRGVRSFDRRLGRPRGPTLFRPVGLRQQRVGAVRRAAHRVQEFAQGHGDAAARRGPPRHGARRPRRLPRAPLRRTSRARRSTSTTWRCSRRARVRGDGVR